MKFDLLIIRGTPGVGKSSLGRRLKKVYPEGVLIEVDNVRGMMNNVNWEAEREHLISLDVVSAAAKSFLESKSLPVIVVDMFMPDKLDYFLKNFNGVNVKVISLLANDQTLTQRLSDRKEGFKNLEKAIALNEMIRSNPFRGEITIDSSHVSKPEIADSVVKLL